MLNFTHILAAANDGIVTVVVFVIVGVIWFISAIVKKVTEAAEAQANLRRRQVFQQIQTSENRQTAEDERLAAARLRQQTLHFPAPPPMDPMMRRAAETAAARLQAMSAPPPAPRAPGRVNPAAPRPVQAAPPPARVVTRAAAADRSVQLEEVVESDAGPHLVANRPRPNPFLAALQRPQILQQQFITMEILGPPLALREPRPVDGFEV